MRLKIGAAVLAVLLLAVAVPGCGSGEQGCTPIADDATSVARLWNEVALGSIRRDFPAPTVHARNLWYLSAVMWDAWSAYTPGTQPYFDVVVTPDEPLDSVVAAKEAISFAAHRLLSARYQSATGGSRSVSHFNRLLGQLCLEPNDERLPGTPAAVGSAIGDAAIEYGLTDGASELTRYISLDYQPVNEPLIVAGGEIDMVDPNRWQPLQLADRITQNGQSQGSGIQVFIGSQWGTVASFSLPAPDDRGITIDPGPPPLLGSDTNAAFVAGAVEVVRYADTLGGDTGAELVDISPATRGNNTVGANNGSGWAENPVTGDPYSANEVPLADYGRAIAEFWADGPDSETPPGHWNALAMEASDEMDQDDLRWAGTGPAITRLEWDLRLFFTMNAALHDAAVAAWGAKQAYDYVRPISMIRYLGSRSELPETPGLVEFVTQASASPGGRHEGLTVGATAVRSWLGPAEDAEIDTAGVGWLEANEWLPYQRPTFVSPAFAAYVSGHSAFSRAAADVLTSATGTEFFPGGMLTHTVTAGSLLHEEGPTVDVELQWATYGDAADEAGESRRYGGIHVAADDVVGRVLGAQVAELAWVKAQEYFPS